MQSIISLVILVKFQQRKTSNPNKSIIIMSLSTKLGSMKILGKSFRGFAKKRKHKFVSTPSLNSLKNEDYHMIEKALNVDYRQMINRGVEIKERLDSAKDIHITTPAGTDFWFNKEGTKAALNTGNFIEYGSGGNLPAGEVYVPPLKKKVDGRIVIDGSVRDLYSTHILKEPVVLKVENGSVTEVSGAPEAKHIEEAFEWAIKNSKFPWGVKRVGEFGIGINPNAGILGPTILNEKSLGTAHVGIGSNAWFGGSIYSIIHLDQVFRNPAIELDGEVLKV